MFRLFGYLEPGRRAGRAPVSSRSMQPAAYAEALLAGWVPPQPEVLARVGPIGQAIDEKPDIAAFLARVYRNQQC